MHRLAHRGVRSSQATPAAVDKSAERLEHKKTDSPPKSDPVICLLLRPLHMLVRRPAWELPALPALALEGANPAQVLRPGGLHGKFDPARTVGATNCFDARSARGCPTLRCWPQRKAP
jgi:hypothetical protein